MSDATEALAVAQETPANAPKIRGVVLCEIGLHHAGGHTPEGEVAELTPNEANEAEAQGWFKPL